MYWTIYFTLNICVMLYITNVIKIRYGGMNQFILDECIPKDHHYDKLINIHLIILNLALFVVGILIASPLFLMMLWSKD